jgi:hypothetical protein
MTHQKDDMDTEALAAQAKELAYEMSRQDVSAALADFGMRRQAFEYAKQTAREFEAAIDRLAALASKPDAAPAGTGAASARRLPVPRRLSIRFPPHLPHQQGEQYKRCESWWR